MGDYGLDLVIVVDNVFVWCCDSSYVIGVIDFFVWYSFICASKSILFLDVENIPKNPAKLCVLRLLVYLLVCVLRMCYRLFLSERK